MRMWGKIWQNNHLLKNTTVTDDTEDTRTHKIFRSLETICHEWDLCVPVWLDSNIREFKQNKKTRFYQDNFVGEEIDFDYLELLVLEED
uniref:hypothetical protein n=1 Tax=Eubacterium cellulosolvens TaxID=29322 RepID=UPI0004882C43|nr:hypothetical protein [[Eubacterium] cellulosolvens]